LLKGAGKWRVEHAKDDDSYGKLVHSLEKKFGN
jgi:hypothetical protein